jgi:hypothetical protein
MQAPPFWQGLREQSLASSSHRTPAKPLEQLQEKPFAASVQDPPFRQGLEAQSSTLDSQRIPENPAGQLQV